VRPLALWCAAGAIALCLGACAGGRPASTIGAAGDTAASAGADSLGAAAAEDRYAEEHAKLLLRIQALRDAGVSDTRMIETLALVSASEELYLQGRIAVASRLLDEAALALKATR
jgi:hypothetical protein